MLEAITSGFPRWAFVHNLFDKALALVVDPKDLLVLDIGLRQLLKQMEVFIRLRLLAT